MMILHPDDVFVPSRIGEEYFLIVERDDKGYACRVRHMPFDRVTVVRRAGRVIGYEYRADHEV
jgi:hypothetical protein